MKITSKIPGFSIDPEFATRLHDLINDYQHIEEIKNIDIHNVEVHYNAFTGIYVYELFFIIDGVYIELQHLSFKKFLLHTDDYDIREIIYEVTLNKINDLIDKTYNSDSKE